MTNGLFTVTLDFGNQFPGADRWLEIAVRTNGGVSFTPLAPRQPLTPTPYAVTAANFNGAIAIAQLPANVITNGASGVNFSGTFSGNLAGLTNLLALDDGVLDTDTNVNYFVKSVANITTTQERNDIAGMIAELKRGGLWNSLADGIILKTNYGASVSSVKTLLGRTAFIRSLPGFTEFGAINPSLSISNLPYDLRTNTIVVVLKQRGDGGGAQGNVSGVAKNLAGVYAGIGDGVRLCVDASYGTIWRKATVETSPYAFIVSESVPAISGGIGVFQDGKRRTFAIVLQGTNATPYVDGAAVGTFAGTFTTAPGNLATAPLTNLWIGSDPAGAFQLDAEVAAVLVFTNALTAAQIVSAEKALRWLEPATENWAVFGDSRGIMSSFVTIDNTTVFWTNGWPSILSRMGRLNRSSVWYNHAISGTSSGQWIAGATDFPFLSNLFQVAVPGGKVTRSHMLVQLGANDLLFDASDSFRVNMQYILSLVKSNGFETWVFTEPAQGTNLIYGPWNDGRRLTNNLWLRTHRELYDHLVERELSFPPGSMDLTNNVNALGKDGLHLSYNGNVRQAQQIYDILNGTPTTFASYATNGAINASLDADGKLTGNFTGDGSGLTNLRFAGTTNAVPPANTTLVKAWLNFTNVTGGVFKLPLYQ